MSKDMNSKITAGDLANGMAIRGYGYDQVVVRGEDVYDVQYADAEDVVPLDFKTPDGELFRCSFLYAAAGCWVFRASVSDGELDAAGWKIERLPQGWDVSTEDQFGYSDRVFVPSSFVRVKDMSTLEGEKVS